MTWQPLAEIDMRSIVFLDKPLLQADAYHLLRAQALHALSTKDFE